MEIKAEIDEATKLARADKEIGLSELTTDVYSKELVSAIRGVTIDKPMTHATLGKAVNL